MKKKFRSHVNKHFCSKYKIIRARPIQNNNETDFHFKVIIAIERKIVFFLQLLIGSFLNFKGWGAVEEGKSEPSDLLRTAVVTVYSQRFEFYALNK